MSCRYEWIECTLWSDFFLCWQQKLTLVRLGKIKEVMERRRASSGIVRDSVKSIPLRCLFLYSPWTKNSFHIYKLLKKIKTQIIFHNTWKLLIYEIQMAVSLNKVFIATQSCSFVFVFSMATFALLCQSGIVVTEIIWPGKLKIFTTWPFTGKVCQSPS